MTNEELRESLLNSPKNGYTRLSADQKEAVNAFAKEYAAFIDTAKTEREATTWAVKAAEEKGFRPLVPGMELKPGDKIYRNNRGKSILLAVMGTENLNNGVNICACMRIPRLLISKPTITAVSRNISGPPFPWLCTALFTEKTAAL